MFADALLRCFLVFLFFFMDVAGVLLRVLKKRPARKSADVQMPCMSGFWHALQFCPVMNN